MKSEWQSYSLDDVCVKIYSGGTPSTKHSDYWNGNLKWLSSGETSQRFIYDTERKITQKGVENSSTKLATKGCTVIATAGQGYTRGQASFLMTDTYMNQSVIACKAKENLILPLYLYYNLDSRYEEFRLLSDGTSTRGGLSGWILKRMEICLPSIEEQNRIVSVLYSLDQKIELNNAINNNLAALLQTIYQERFGDVSMAADQGILSDICLYSRDRVAVSELNVSTYFSTENMLSGKAGSTEATSLPTTPQTTACHKGDTLISNIRPYFKKIVYCEDKCGCSTDVLCFTPVQSQYAAYLFSTLYADKFFAFMVAGSKGTKMPRGDKQQIMTYPVILPSKEELEGFNAIALPILKQICSYRAENKRLFALRDSLLPKLMSGETDVSNIQL